MDDSVTVYRSADSTAAKDARQIAALLDREGIAATLLDDSAPGVIQGSVEVRVAPADSSRAEELIARFVPGPDADQDQEPDPDPAEFVPDSDAPGELDLVPLPTFAENAANRWQALALKSLLESNGVYVLMKSDLLAMPVRMEMDAFVPREQLNDAARLIAEAVAAGPEAAEQAERESEISPTPQP